MRAFTVLAVLGVVVGAGCGGDKDPNPFTDAAGDDDDDGGPVTISCEIPFYDLPGLSCEQLGSAWGTTMGDLSACNADQDCRALKAQCEHWNDVLCYYAVNFCVDDDATVVDTIATFNSESSNCGDTSDQCDCGGEPDVACENHTCTFVNTVTTP